MTGYESKRAAAQDKLNDDDDTQVYGNALNEDAIIIQYHEATIKRLEKRIEELMAQPEQEPTEAWPCVIETADFEEDTVTLAMQCTDYKVSAGKHWLSTTPPQRTEERNFCPRCGKRTADLTVIHTCTPPQEKNK